MLIIGVSGGADSVCLLDVLHELSKKNRFALHVAHVNYGLRGQASSLDEALVRSMAKKYRLPCSVLALEPRAKKVSEERLRDIRYVFFEKLRRTTQAHYIAVAHHQDDQAETLLLRLLRGAGLAGLASMRAKNTMLIRPLIEMNRADILRYLKERNLLYREDASNADTQYLRNRVRRVLIPLLATEFQPQISKILAETAHLIGEDYAFLENLSANFSIKRTASGVEFSRTALLSLPLPLIRRELRKILRPLLADKPPAQSLLYELMKALQSRKNKTQTITFQGLKFVRKGDRVRLIHF